MKLKVKQFSHNDLDGVGAVIVGKHAFGDNLDYTCCAYGDINKKVKEFIEGEEFESTDLIFVTDISVNDPELIELIEKKAKGKFLLLDHHGTAEGLNQYEWARVSEYEKVDGVERLSSGTTAFYFFLVKNGLLKETTELRDFVEQVRSYDTWDWDRVEPKNVIAYQLNSLHNLIGRWKFIERFSKNCEVLFNTTESTLLEVEKRRTEQVIYQKRESMLRKTLTLPIGTFEVGVVFSDSYHSELGNILADENPDLDFILLINGGNRLSFRGVKESIDLGIVASHFGGGGHPMAAGAVLDLKTQEGMVESIFLNGIIQ